MIDDRNGSKGLGFLLVTVPDAGDIAAKGKGEQGAARVFYLAATHATQRLVSLVGGHAGFGATLNDFKKPQGKCNAS